MNKIVEKRRYTVGEEIFSATAHGIGAVFSVVALILMLLRTSANGDAVSVLSAAVFGTSLIVLYSMSTLYHALTGEKAKKVFRIFDHATIFLLIAGTYTPYLLITLRGTMGWILFFVLWGLTAIGIVFDSIMLDRFHKVEMVLYVAMGWCVLLTGKTLVANLAAGGIWLVLAGGILYTLGIVFYSMKKIPYMHSVWHLFVLGGSVLQFFSVYLYVL
ncbi:MAG: hemolysin III family protein [Clostridia bacterium]|nr:hemolysin III family protein [Clostridia bacterium]